jgi:hypothetical protein
VVEKGNLRFGYEAPDCRLTSHSEGLTERKVKCFFVEERVGKAISSNSRPREKEIARNKLNGACQRWRAINVPATCISQLSSLPFCCAL